MSEFKVWELILLINNTHHSNEIEELEGLSTQSHNYILIGKAVVFDFGLTVCLFEA